MASSLEVVPADHGSSHQQFIATPYHLHRSNPLWTPPLRLVQRDLLNVLGNPFYRHAALRCFVARRGGHAVGRVAVIRDDAHIQHFNERVGHFGFFECADDPEAAQALLAACAAAARDWGLDTLRGPFSPSINHECGVLVEGFDRPAAIMMPYNPPYYDALLAGCGLAKHRDLVSYRMALQAESALGDERLDFLRAQCDLSYRPVNMRRLDEEARHVWGIYNTAWADNWGQYPLSEAEFRHFFKEFRLIARPEHLWMAVAPDGEIVGFSLVLPNYHEAVQPLRDGRLLPLGWLRLLWGCRRGAIRGARGLLMGFLPAYRATGANIVLYSQNLVPLIRLGCRWVELGWMLEDNRGPRRAAELLGAKPSTRHRIYAMKLA